MRSFKYHIIYKTTCLKTDKWYVGMHSTNDLGDGYFGSGKILVRSLRKHGAFSHVREILATAHTREELRDIERLLITEDMLNDPNCMNLVPGGGGNGGRVSLTHEQIMKAATAGGAALRLKKHDAEFAKMVSERISAAQFGRQHSEVTKLKMSVAKLGKSQPNIAIAKGRPCTIDGTQIYPSLCALKRALGQGANGSRSPNFRYVK